MKYKKIHACRNDCCLFRKELSDANVCPSCGMSRWKIPKNLKKEVKNVPVKVMWYFSPIPRDSNVDRASLSASSFIRSSKEQLDQAHLYVIQNVALALEVLKNSITPSLRWIAHRPSPDVATYSGYMINDYYYHTKGMLILGEFKIVELCDWVDNRSGVKVDELGFTIVDLKRIGHKSDSFILATQVKQVFYFQDSSNPEWSVALTSPQRTIEEDFFEDEIGDMLQEYDYGTIQRMPNVDTPNEIDDTTLTYIRHDCEGRWIEKGM
ncbi:transposase [Cucumis melo var. makuwa]|uniref:Transposase n=1 Tax=Cucumis melo var. makuwa TaxID=1194695 RepID=A0A5D3BQ31_CUCMM|nr:transposase [Cucumis melo var. makuwa]